jgi:hypothetical protein
MTDQKRGALLIMNRLNRTSLLLDNGYDVTALDTAEHEVIHWALKQALPKLRERQHVAVRMGMDDQHLKAAERLIEILLVITGKP